LGLHLQDANRFGQARHARQEGQHRSTGRLYSNLSKSKSYPFLLLQFC
jgi:hypothetical protein